jgi:predicted nucleic-acid-binding protein
MGRPVRRITVDTNVLVRALVGDDPAQAEAASAALLHADQICVAMPSLCELVWVLKRVYDVPIPEIAGAIRALLNADTVALDRAAAEAG